MARTTQPTLQVSTRHLDNDISGKVYVEQIRAITVTISGSGSVDPWLIPAGTFIDEIILHVNTALDDGTVDVGDEDTADAWIDNTEFTETSLNAVISSRLLTKTSGKYYSAAKKLRVTVGGAATEGVILLLVKYITLTDMATIGYHNEAAVG